MKKRVLLTALCVALVAIIGIFGTVAYLTDSEAKTNTFTVGDIDISIAEWKYDNGWTEYEDGEFMLNPLESDQGIALYNKSVRTYNDSTSGNAAYIRSFVLIEKNPRLADSYVNEGNCCFPGIHLAYDMTREDGSTTYTSSYDSSVQHASKPGGSLDTTVTIDGKEYWVVWYIAADENAIPVGEALSSLLSVWMDKNITTEQIGGWGEDGVQVIVFSQGIQEDGLTHAEAMAALGEVTVANVQAWYAEAVAE